MASSKNELQEVLQKEGLKLPEYIDESSTGPSHSPCFVCRVRVQWKDGRELEERGEGRKKKDAHQIAASRMLQRIRGGPVEREDAFEDQMLAPASPIRAPASPGSVKGELQTLVQRIGLSVPTYTLLPARGSAHDRTHTVKLQVWATPQVELWTGMASARTKKEAEALVAREALDYLQDSNNWDQLAQRFTQRLSPAREPEQEESQEDMLASLQTLEGLKVSYVPEKGEDGVSLCMGLAQSGSRLLPHPVASHGQGTSPQDAEKEAAYNLIHNISKLFPDIR